LPRDGALSIPRDLRRHCALRRLRLGASTDGLLLRRDRGGGGGDAGSWCSRHHCLVHHHIRRSSGRWRSSSLLGDLGLLLLLMLLLGELGLLLPLMLLLGVLRLPTFPLLVALQSRRRGVRERLLRIRCGRWWRPPTGAPSVAQILVARAPEINVPRIHFC
jgi:hypothetical protein